MKPCLFDESGGFFPTKLFFQHQRSTYGGMIDQMTFGISWDSLLSNYGDISGCECLKMTFGSILANIQRKIIHHGMSLYSQKDQEKVQFITISCVLLPQHIFLGFLYPVVKGIGIYSCSPAFLFFPPFLCRHFYVAIVFPGNPLVFSHFRPMHTP